MSNLTDQELHRLILDPRESLGVEMKSWFDPDSNEGKAKIVKACIALRNNDGGLFIIGFNDDGSQNRNGPTNVREAFHPDKMQQVVTKYASQSFEVFTHFVLRDGIEHPVLEVSAGVRTPVACTKGLGNDDPLLKSDAIYVRTLDRNHRVSTSLAPWKALESLTTTCFNNREADIGAFIRRHLSSIDLATLAGAVVAASAKTAKSATEQALEWLDIARARLDDAMKGREFEISPEMLGTYEVATVLTGDFIPPPLSGDLLQKIAAETPHHSGWPPWVILPRGDGHPQMTLGGWEALVVRTQLFSTFDFWRIEPGGRLYLLRVLDDDLQAIRKGESPQRTAALDFALQTSRTAEILSTAISLAHSLGCEPASTSLSILMRWRHIKGRRLCCWSEPNRNYWSLEHAVDDEVLTDATLPLDIAPTAITPYVEKLLQPLFGMFGSKFDSSVIDGIVQRTIARSM